MISVSQYRSIFRFTILNVLTIFQDTLQYILRMLNKGMLKNNVKIRPKLKTLGRFCKQDLVFLMANINNVSSKKFIFAIMSNVMTHTRMSEAVPLQVVTLEKPHVTNGTSIWLHP